MKILGQAFWLEMGRAFVTVFRRFPLAVISGLGCAVALSFLVDYGFRDDLIWQPRLIRLSIACGAGISVFILTALISEPSGGLFSRNGVVGSLLGLVFLVLFYRWIPIEGKERLLHHFWIRFLMLAGIVHVGIAVVPFWKTKEADFSLWEFNKELFVRFLLSAFFSAVFFVGVVVALVSIDKLFGVDLDEENYARIWFFCAFVLNTCLFLGGMPSTEDRLGLVLDYPKWIQFFSKFILLPLVILYFTILYAYAAKILFTWSWPNGMVGLPVFVLSVIGGLTGLLIWPLSHREPITLWAKSFWRFFFPLFIPLAVLLLLALQRRIGDYGFTEIRYLGILLAGWLLCVSVFYTIMPSSSFKVVPWSIAGLLIVFVVGPLSPASVAFNSQSARLDKLLNQEGLLKEGTLVSNPHDVENSVYEDLRSIFRYLREGYGTEFFEAFISGMDKEDRQNNEGTDWLELSPYLFSQAILDYSGLRSTGGIQYSYYDVRVEEKASTFVGEDSAVYVIQGYSLQNGILGTFSMGGKEVQIVTTKDSTVLLFQDSLSNILGRLDFAPWIEAKNINDAPVFERDNQRSSPEELTFEVDIESAGTIQLIARHIRLNQDKDTWSLVTADFWVLVPVGNSSE